MSSAPAESHQVLSPSNLAGEKPLTHRAVFKVSVDSASSSQETMAFVYGKDRTSGRVNNLAHLCCVHIPDVAKHLALCFR